MHIYDFCLTNFTIFTLQNQNYAKQLSNVEQSQEIMIVSSQNLIITTWHEAKPSHSREFGLVCQVNGMPNSFHLFSVYLHVTFLRHSDIILLAIIEQMFRGGPFDWQSALLEKNLVNYGVYRNLTGAVCWLIVDTYFS